MTKAPVNPVAWRVPTPWRALGVTLAVTALLGCSQLPTYQRPAVDVPGVWPSAQANARASALPWQDFVREPALRALVAEALRLNPDLRVASLRIEQARAQYDIRSADRLPGVNLAATGNRQPASGGGISSTYAVGLAFSSWELDLFGRLASLREAALAEYLATEHTQRAAQISLVAAVSSGWLVLQSAQVQQALAQATLDTRTSSLRLTRLRFDQGAASAVEWHQAQSLEAVARAALAQSQRQVLQARNALTALVGRALTDAELPQPGSGDAGVTALAEVPVGLPSEVLFERPDVRAAEQALVAANAQIGAARAAFFPRVSLTASAGTVSSELSSLFHAGQWGWTLAPQALLPIFDHGRNQAGLASAEAGREVALAQYEKAIQAAFREVADALAGQETLATQRQAQLDQVGAEAQRARLAQRRVDAGVASELERLDAERALFAARQAVLQTTLAQAQNQVALYKALGGGWTPPDPTR